MQSQKDISYQHNMAGSVRINTSTPMNPMWKFWVAKLSAVPAFRCWQPTNLPGFDLCLFRMHLWQKRQFYTHPLAVKFLAIRMTVNWTKRMYTLPKPKGWGPLTCKQTDWRERTHTTAATPLKGAVLWPILLLRPSLSIPTYLHESRKLSWPYLYVLVNSACSDQIRLQ
jgi:hypothetical protein